MGDVRDYLPLSAPQFQILLALSDADRHGYGIILEIAERTGGSTRLGTGTLYTALAGLADNELIEDTDSPAVSAAGRRGPREARPGGRGPRSEERAGRRGPREASPEGRGPRSDNDDARRRYYRLTPFGRAVLEAETSRLDALVKQARRKGVTPIARPALQASSRTK
jgi:DNA-binding PadR family transcriptional regulator